MLTTVNHLDGVSLHAIDGEIGNVREAYFDDDSWTIRYLVVDAGTWFSRRDVLISPYSVRQPWRDAQHIEVTLTREQVKHSPDVDT